MSNNVNSTSVVFRAVNACAGYLKVRRPQRSAVWLCVLVAGLITAGSLVASRHVLAASKSWVGGVSVDWNDPNNWSPVGVPVAGDDVSISTATNEPSITAADVTVHNLNIGAGRTLTVGSSRTLTVDGTSGFVSLFNAGAIGGSGVLKTQGNVDFENRGSVTASLSISSIGPSLTRTHNDDGTALATFSGPITVVSGAVLQLYINHTLASNGDLTVNSGGTITYIFGNETLRFNGSTLTNNGTIAAPNVDFNRNGSQSIAGTGTWTGKNINIGVSGSGNATNTSLSVSQTFGITDTLTVNSGNTLTVNNPLTVGTANITNRGTISISSTLSHNPAMASVKTFLNGTGATVSGAGAFQAQGDIDLDNQASFSAPLSVSSSGGSLTRVHNSDGSGLATFGGTITVVSGGTLQVYVNHTLAANADVTVNSGGTMTFIFGNETLQFNGSTLTNNGTIAVPNVDFNRNGTQSIAGTGMWTGRFINIGVNGSGNATNTSLSGAQTFSITETLTVNSGNTLTVNNPLTIGGANLTNRGTISISSTLSYNPAMGFVKIFFNGPGGTVSGTGTFQAQGDIALDNQASFSAPLSISSTGGSITRIRNTDGSGLATFGGPITIGAGATAQVVNNHTLVANADFTVNSAGNLINLFGNEFLQFNSATLTNNGTIAIGNVDFNRNGAQTIAGAGMWTGKSINIGVSGSGNATNTSLTGAQTFGISDTLTVNSGNTLTVNNPLTVGAAHITNKGSISISSTLSYNPTMGSVKNLQNAFGAIVSGTGAFQAQGDIDFDNRGSFSAPLSITSGGGSITRIHNTDGSSLATFGGPITIGASATAQVLTNHTLISNADFTINSGGTLVNQFGNETLQFNGATLTNNGTLPIAHVDFNRAGSQTLTGSGPFVSNTATVLSGSTVTLGSDSQMATLVITSGGRFDQGASFNLTAGPITVNSGGGLRNLGTGDLTLTANLTNDGFVAFNGNGGSCGDPDSILIRSSVDGTQRQWSGSGVFAMQDLDVKDQAGSAAVTVISGTNSGNNGANWVFDSGCIPTDVTLESFSATAYQDGIPLLQWRTGFEAGNLGFNVYREASGRRELINPQMIAGSALVAGSGVMMRAGRSYTWWDKGIADCRLSNADCRNAAYWLEDVDINGKSTLHGPFAAKAIGGAAPVHSQAAMLSQIGDAKPFITAGASSSWSEASRSNASQNITVEAKSSGASLATTLASGPAVKLSVREDGWYRVTQPELLAAGLEPKTDPRNLQLYLGGVEQALLVTGESDGRLDSTDVVELYGKGLDTPSSDTHVYWLVAGKQRGKRINIIPSHAKPGGAQSFSYTVERKERSLYFSGLLNGDAENFFGRVVSSQPVEQSIPLQHLDTRSSAAEVEVALQGVSDLAGSTDHQVSVALNGVIIGRVVFDGREHKMERFSVYPTQLREGENTVALTGQNSGDITLIDYVRITYAHTYSAETDKLTLTASLENGASQTIQGFSTPMIRVMDVTDPAAVVNLAGEIESLKGGTFAVTVDVPGGDRRTLMAFTDAEIKRPSSIIANQPSNLRSTNNGADMLIITRREFAASLEPLRLLRQSQGLSVSIVDVEDIYDEFNFGEKAAQPLKDFVGYAATNWKKKPRFVLLAGDASFDSRNYLGFGDNDFVPTKLIDTQYMETASDDWLGDFDNDGLAEVAVGRLPVRTATEASMMAAKIVGYERSSPSDEMLLVSDVSDGYDFESASARLASLAPVNLRVNRIDRGHLDAETAKRTLIEAINRGQKIVNYAGHGSVDLWSGGLLTGSDARGLGNAGRLSFFVMMTCLNGYFQDASLDSLGEALMKADGGAAAVWASTAMTAPNDQWTMNEELYRAIFGGGGVKGQTLTIGEAARRAKARITDIDVRRTWVLLGDPAMKLR